MKNFLRYFWIILLITGCVAGELTQRNYYVLEYFSHSEKEDLFQTAPFNSSILVYDAVIPQTYNRKQIVLRQFGPKIQYADNDLWGVKLSDVIPDMITKRMDRYGVFKSAAREYLDEIPEFEIHTTINNIEFLNSENSHQAKLNMDFYFGSTETENYLLAHRTDIVKELYGNDYEAFVQKINELILNETDVFIKKIVYFMETGKRDFDDISKQDQDEDVLMEAISFDESSIGKGSIYVPALSNSDNEPYYVIKDNDGIEVGSAKPGTALSLPGGFYSISYGSGSEQQKILKTLIEVIPGIKTIVKPDWGCLTVDIMDQNRDFVKTRYEVFDAETGESYGAEYPAEAELGELQNIWMLRSGMYKITIDNEPFNAFQNFTTVYVKENKIQELSIIVNTEDEEGIHLVGAGVLGAGDILDRNKNLKWTNAIHGNANLNSSNEIDRDKQETTITLNGQLDSRLVYDKFPIHYSMKGLMETGTTKEPEQDFRISSDEFYIKNTGIYYFLKNLGVYSRLDMDTHIFTEYDHTDSTHYIYEDEDGEIQETGFSDKIRTKPSFFPLTLKEGLGINYRILNISKASLNLRGGFGLRQNINKAVYVKATDGDTLDVYQKQLSENIKGIETSLIGVFRLPWNVSYTLDADFLFPFGKDESITMDWENIINVKLFKYVSLDYKLNFHNYILESGEEYIVTDHSLFLRVTYFLK